MPNASSVTVLAYHRVELPARQGLAPTVIDAYPAEFERQMRYVAAHCNVVGSGDVVRALRDGFTLPPRALVITFDDGYTSFAEAAMPVLRRLALPVTLFVATGLTSEADALFWWDRLFQAITGTELEHLDVPGVGRLDLSTPAHRRSAYKLLVGLLERTPTHRAEHAVARIVEACGVSPRGEHCLLTWDELRALRAEGVEIGAHSRTHPVLSRTTAERLKWEIEGSWCDLKQQIPDALPLFCYPTGKPHAVNRQTADAVRAAGMVGAYTMVPGINRIGRTDPYLLRRVGMVAGQAPLHFKVRIGASGRVYRRLKMLFSKQARAELSF